MTEAPLLSVRDLAVRFGRLAAVDGVSFDLWPGEVVAIVGESGSGKTTLLRAIHGFVQPAAGSIRYRSERLGEVELTVLEEPSHRLLARTEWGFVHQNPRDGLRLSHSAGANVGERLMAAGARHWGNIRAQALAWLERVEIDPARIDDLARTFSGGMQQRLQIARVLVNNPRLVLMDEPTGGLDVSVQARLLDLIRRLVTELRLSVIVVTHDLGVARLLAQRILVMQRGRIVEAGLADQVLDDPQHPYSQLLVSSVLAA
ncbi:MAG: phosphonate C-P lyase system protein PhnK [Elioraea sp.]|nr:phosphonate C-P lyase system protein PhnK [Elioraea sp.]